MTVLPQSRESPDTANVQACRGGSWAQPAIADMASASSETLKAKEADACFAAGREAFTAYSACAELCPVSMAPARAPCSACRKRSRLDQSSPWDRRVDSDRSTTSG